MPYQDGTGPQGQGPRTGRGMGNCNGQGGTRRGRGNGRGFGRGRGGVNDNQENFLLKNLQAAIEKLTERLDKISKE